MAYVMVILLLVAIAGALWWGVLAIRRHERPLEPAADHDVTDREPIPPVHPRQPLPGSQTARDEDR